MIYEDNPIKTKKEDKLNYSDFADKIADIIIKYKFNEFYTKSLTIGLLGEWGSGKSSILNLFEQSLNNKLKLNDKQYIIFNFDPWNFSNKESIYLYFFGQLSSILKKEKRTDKLIKFLNKYSDEIISATEIMIDNINGTSIGLISKIGLKLLKKSINDNNREISTLYDLKEKINEEIMKFLKDDQKIIIEIDNIDRLTDKQVQEIFQLVNSLADFRGIVYILSFDKEVVTKALVESQKYSSEEYINKIIQIPIVIPTIDSKSLELLFNSYLDNLCKVYDISLGNNSYELKEWSIFKYYLKNIRDLKRYFNILNFYLPPIKNEVKIRDFMYILLIQLFEPHVYKQIIKNKNILIEDFRSDRRNFDENYLSILNPSKELSNDINLSNNYYNINNLSKRSDEQDGVLKDILSTIFPRTTRAYNDKGPRINSIEQYRVEKCICTDEYFNNYFKFDTSLMTIAQQDINDLLDSTKDKQLFQTEVLNLYYNNKSTKILKRFKDYIMLIPIENFKNIIKVLIEQRELLEQKQGNEYVFIIGIIHQLLAIIENKNERFYLLKDVIENVVEIKLINIVELLTEEDKIEKRFRFKDDSDLGKNSLFSLNHLDILENIVSTKIFFWSKPNYLLNYPRLIDNLFSMKDWLGNYYFSIFINDLLNNDKNILKFIQLFYDENKKEYDIENLNYLINITNFVNILKRIKLKNFNNNEKDQICKCINDIDEYF